VSSHGLLTAMMKQNKKHTHDDGN